MMKNIKRKIHELLDPSEGGTKWDTVVNSILVTLIILNTCAVILETVENIYSAYKIIFKNFELISISIFTVEYLLRLWTCTCIEKYKHPLIGRIKFIFSVGGLIDLLAILPFYIPLITSFDLRFIRILRLLRFFRFFKLGRYLNASRIISKVFKSKREELVLSLVITIFLIIIASSVMYYVEHDAQPNKFSSIPETMWWSVATLTTVGYGDLIPITTLGKTLSAVISILGIGMFALPAGILASGFSEAMKKSKEEKNKCPHCGKEIE